ncbi:MAG: squalene--hopene cyclase, partial [Rhodospirillales bacterium]|nr:squalene--hopene cyclase [Rhodospirillales bacterium]
MPERNVASLDANRTSDGDLLDTHIDEAVEWLSACQAKDGHWAFELEADVTIPSEYIMLNHFLDEIDEAVEA